MKDNIAVVSNNIGEGVKVGSSNINGIYIGNTLITDNKFDIKQLLNNIFIPDDYNNVSDDAPRLLIINLSDSSDTILYRNGVQTKIPAQHIEWYTYSLGDTITYVNQGNSPLQVFQETYLINSNSNSYTIAYHKLVARNGNNIIDNDYNPDGYTLMTCIVMNE